MSGRDQHQVTWVENLRRWCEWQLFYASLDFHNYLIHFYSHHSIIRPLNNNSTDSSRFYFIERNTLNIILSIIIFGTLEKQKRSSLGHLVVNMVLQIFYLVQSFAEFIILSFNDYMMAFIDLIAIMAIASCFAKTASEPPRRNWFSKILLRSIGVK